MAANRFSKNMTSLQLLRQTILLKTSSMCTGGKWIHSRILVTISKFGNMRHCTTFYQTFIVVRARQLEFIRYNYLLSSLLRRNCLALDLSLNEKIKSG